MAVLFPDLEVIKRQKVKPTEGELALLNFLCANLDDSFDIFYQPYLNGDQPDIILMKKDSGIVIFEVKDWKLEFYEINLNTDWVLKKNKSSILSPLKQLESYKQNLFNLHIDELREKSIHNKNLWATVNCVIYFHNASEIILTNFLLENFNSESYSKYIKFVNYFGILGRDSLNLSKLEFLKNKFWLNRKSFNFDENLYLSVKRYLKPPFHQLEDGIEIIYTKAQTELIRSEIRPRRKVKGVAGAGKTLVLAKRAVNAHKRTNGVVLILTYNLSLKNYIHDRINDVREGFEWRNFEIINYHQFFKAKANEYNLEIKCLDVFQDKVFFEPVKDIIIKYDVVLIDEIQDYKQEWIDIITEYFLDENSEFVVFGDEKQNIYNRELNEEKEPVVRKIPGNFNKTLNTSHRFGSNIATLAMKFQNKFFSKKYTLDDITAMSQFDFEKRILNYFYLDQFSIENTVNEIYEILKQNEIHSSDVAILSSKVELLIEIEECITTLKHENTNTTFENKIEHEENKNNIPFLKNIRRFKKNHFWMKTGTVKISTIHSFKGWEISTLILIIEKQDQNDELIYTALTRARKNLIIFNLGNVNYHSFFNQEF